MRLSSSVPIILACLVLASAPVVTPRLVLAAGPNDLGITQEPGGDITEKEIDATPFDAVAPDDGFITPVAMDLSRLDADARKRFDEWAAKLDDWEPGKDGSAGQRVRNLLAVAAIADLAHSEFEGETGYLVFRRLRDAFSKDQLIQATAWVALRPKEGTAVTSAPELGFENKIPEEVVRERSSAYAVKLLGRLLGKLPQAAKPTTNEAKK